MPRIIGRLTKVGIGKETTRGTAVAPTFWVPVRDLGFDDKVELTDNDSGFGVLAEINDAAITKQWADGDFAGKIFDRSVGLEMTGVFGQSPTSVQRATSGVYDHTFTMLQSNQHVSLTVALKDANNDLRYALAMVDTWKLEGVMDDYARRTMNLISKKSASASNTSSYIDENEFIPKHITVVTAATAAGLDAGTAMKVRSVDLEINKNAEGLQALGSSDLDDVANKQVTIEGSIELYYDSVTQRNLVFNATKNAMRISMKNTDVTIGGSHNPELRFDLNNVIYSSWEKGFDNNDVMTETLEFKAAYSIADAALIVARLTNAYAGTAY